MQNTAFSTNKTLNIRGRIVHLARTSVMGILNITPDSFYSGSRVIEQTDILKRAEQMLSNGATFIDVGGYSSRPGAADIEISEELSRVVRIIKALVKNFPEALISIDTFRSDIAHVAASEGASLINDISAGELDPKMLSTAGAHKIPYIMMHMRGTPQTMTSLSQYDDVVSDVNRYFSERIPVAHQVGITDIIIDPGFGFAKTREHNFELLRNLNLFHCHNKMLMVGLSRKSMVWKTLNIEPESALNGTTVVHTMALLKGVDILRVHDVKEAVEAVKLVQMLQQKTI